MNQWNELKNTIVCGLSRLDDLKKHANDRITVIGSPFFPDNLVYHVDDEGILSIYDLNSEEFNERTTLGNEICKK